MRPAGREMWVRMMLSLFQPMSNTLPSPPKGEGLGVRALRRSDGDRDNTASVHERERYMASIAVSIRFRRDSADTSPLRIRMTVNPRSVRADVR